MSYIALDLSESLHSNRKERHINLQLQNNVIPIATECIQCVSGTEKTEHLTILLKREFCNGGDT